MDTGLRFCIREIKKLRRERVSRYFCCVPGWRVYSRLRKFRVALASEMAILSA